MYWDDTNSQIYTLLEQKDVSVETILNEDDVLDECINNNKQLIEFLSKEESMIRMLTIMTTKPDDKENIMENYKLSNTICEILTHEKNEFSSVIAQNEKYLSILWSFLTNYDQETINKNEEVQTYDQNVIYMESNHLNPLLASFFSKVFLYTFTHYNKPVLEFLQSRHSPNDLVTVIMKHINVSAIMDFIFKAWEYSNTIGSKLNSQNVNNESYNPILNKILINNKFAEKLIDVFKYAKLESKQQNVAQLITELFRVKRELLGNVIPEQEQDLHTYGFESEEMVKRLLDNMLECRTKCSIVNGLKIIQVLLQYNHLNSQNFTSQQEVQLLSMFSGTIKSSTLAQITADFEDGDETNIELEAMPKVLKQQNTDNGQNETKFMPPQMTSPVDALSEHLFLCVRNVSNVLNERLEDFVLLLTDTTNLKPIKTTAGIIEKPLGILRLEIVHLFVALFATSNYMIMKKCHQLNVLQILTKLFFDYTLNNQLHKFYNHIIGYLFQNFINLKIIYDEKRNNMKESDNENAAKKLEYFKNLFEISRSLIKQLLIDCNLLEKILESFSNEKIPVKSSEIKKESAEQSNNEKMADLKREDKDEIKSDDINDADNDGGGDEKKNDDFEMKEKSDDIEEKTGTKTNVSTEINDEKEHEEKNCEIIDNVKLKATRPGYMGHLRLIANTLKTYYKDELFDECNLNVLPRWQEFVDGHLAKLNALISSELVPLNDSQYVEEKFNEFQNDPFWGRPNLPENVKLFENNFGQNQLMDINDQLKLLRELLDNDIDLDKYWNNPNVKFKKHLDFKLKSSESDDNNEESKQLDDFNNEELRKKSTREFLINSIQDDFALDKKDPVLRSYKISPDYDFDFFNTIDSFNMSNEFQMSTENQDTWFMGDSAQSSSNKDDNYNWAIFPTQSSEEFNENAGENSNNESDKSVIDNLNNTTNDDNDDDDDDDVFATNVTSTSSPVRSNENDSSEQQSLVKDLESE